MTWEVEFHADFDPEFQPLPKEVKLAILANVLLLRQFGPNIRRPRVSTLSGFRHQNMKELRFDDHLAQLK